MRASRTLSRLAQIVNVQLAEQTFMDAVNSYERLIRLPVSAYSNAELNREKRALYNARIKLINALYADMRCLWKDPRPETCLGKALEYNRLVSLIEQHELIVASHRDDLERAERIAASFSAAQLDALRTALRDAEMQLNDLVRLRDAEKVKLDDQKCIDYQDPSRNQRVEVLPEADPVLV